MMQGLGFGPTKEEFLELVSELLIKGFVEHYPLSEGGIDKMLAEMEPFVDKALKNNITMEGLLNG